MKHKAPRVAQTFPVMAGAPPAPRADQIAGIVQRVWAEAAVYHGDVEPLLREWLNAERCVVGDSEFASLLAKARGEFNRVASTDVRGALTCPAYALVACLYLDVEELPRA